MKNNYYDSSIEYPDDCIVDFDMRLIDLFKKLDQKSLTTKERITHEFYRVKEKLDGKIPTRMQLFTYMDDDVYRYCITHAKENPFRHYLEFLEKLHELSETEETLCSGLGKDFLTLIETTDMQKVYKMPILYSFLNHGNVRLAVKDDEVLAAWKDFFDTGKNWKDFAADITYDEYKSITDKQHLRKAKSMPIKYLKASGKGFFVEKDGIQDCEQDLSLCSRSRIPSSMSSHYYYNQCQKSSKSSGSKPASSKASSLSSSSINRKSSGSISAFSKSISSPS